MAGLAGISKAARSRAAEAGMQLEATLQAAFGAAGTNGRCERDDGGFAPEPPADESDEDGAAALVHRIAAALGGCGAHLPAALRQMQAEARRLIA